MSEKKLNLNSYHGSKELLSLKELIICGTYSENNFLKHFFQEFLEDICYTFLVQEKYSRYLLEILKRNASNLPRKCFLKT